MMRRFVCLLCLFALTGLGACAGAPVTSESDSRIPSARSEKEECLASGGLWQMFNNGCQDSCDYRRGEVTMCTQIQKLGCYCKGNRCWNGARCENI
jgi:hypothetical protein